MIFSVYQLVGTVEGAGSPDQKQKLALTILIPLGIAFFGFAHSALMPIMNRGLVGDLEISDLAVEEAELFRNAFSSYIQSTQSREEMLSSLQIHLKRAEDLHNRIWVKIRRDRALSHWRNAALRLSTEISDANVPSECLNRKIQALIEKLPAKGCFAELVQASLQSYLESVDTIGTPETTKPAQGGLSH
jgi:hypothetical protein